ncbi:Pyruvate decarboxylase 1 [Orbilia oligospora]|uniref:Pyruvate decarboxylase n=1 Tax=Orbilia oligospora TaxID=2813651 RepID=A0A7C8USL5_ORBOL|nr:Pyruvate decarboxylase 1 [Orbilia oligospora]KAF3226232.1 Pyruvate decarboxylase 1 [Orbilia oligospora]
MGEEIEIVNYLFRRLHQLGIRSVHGVPGDFNLVALDYLEPAGLHWVGNCSELNAGYAADGYARINGMSAIITTFGVGELSAVPAIAGSYSERVSVVHIVGIPSAKAEKHGVPVHHSFADGDYSVFRNISKNISQVCITLDDSRNAAKDIDRVLQGLPTDMVLSMIPAQGLNTPLDLAVPSNDPNAEADAVELISKALYESNNAIVLVDGGAIRYRALKETREFVERSQLPIFVTSMGRGAINEADPNFNGVYIGDVSGPEIQQAVQSADLVFSIGAVDCDFNSGGFTNRTQTKHTIELHPYYTKIGYATYATVGMKLLLQKLLDAVDFEKVHSPQNALARTNVPQRPSDEAESPEYTSQEISQKWLWSSIGDWLQEGDVVIADVYGKIQRQQFGPKIPRTVEADFFILSGTSSFGIMSTRFPKGVTCITQVLWGSIGFSVGACQGAALAVVESDQPSRRVILFVGDGSFQLTGTEVSTMIRHGLKPIIVLINNDGYTTERIAHGPEMGYNDIQPWKYRKFLRAFGANKGEYKNFAIKTKSQFKSLFKQGTEFSKANVIQYAPRSGQT